MPASRSTRSKHSFTRSVRNGVAVSPRIHRGRTTLCRCAMLAAASCWASSTTSRSSPPGGSLSNIDTHARPRTPIFLAAFSAAVWASRFRRIAAHPTRAPNSSWSSRAISSPITVLPLPVGDSISTLRAAGAASPAAPAYRPARCATASRTIRAWYGRG